MTIAYFDCFAGISGDMTLGALIDAGADRNLLDAAIEALRLGDEVSVEVRHEQRGHAGGKRVVVQTRDRVERTLPDLRAASAWVARRRGSMISQSRSSTCTSSVAPTL